MTDPQYVRAAKSDLNIMLKILKTFFQKPQDFSDTNSILAYRTVLFFFACINENTTG